MYKNKLQEYCQKHDFSLPKYSTKKVGGVPHKPVWKSTVTVNDMTYTGNKEFLKKNSAEQDVARIAVENIREIKIEKKLSKKPVEFFSKIIITNLAWYKHIFLVDLENQPHISGYNVPENILVIGVVGHCHPLAGQDIGIEKCVINSSVKDAADHALTFIAGMLSHHVKEGQFLYIVSRDHYAEATVKCLQSMGIVASHLPRITEKELINYFSHK